MAKARQGGLPVSKGTERIKGTVCKYFHCQGSRDLGTKYQQLRKIQGYPEACGPYQKIAE